MAILYGSLMLAGFTWLGPFCVNPFCPHTCEADCAPGPNCCTRLLAVSATYRLPLASTFRSVGVASVLGAATGKAPVLAVTVEKSVCPKTRVAGPPEDAAAGNISTRLSAGTAT